MITRSPRAIYLNPMPPVYKNDKESPPKYMNERSSSLAGDISSMTKKANDPHKYNETPKLVISFIVRILSTNILSDTVLSLSIPFL